MSQLEDLLQQCTVKLTLPGRLGWGTGFFVAPGWILTCAHVVQEARDESVQVRWQKQENWAQATVERLLADPFDLALLKVTGSAETSPPCVYFDEEIRSRDPLYLFGYPDQDFPNGCPVTFNCEGLTGNESALIKFALGQVRPGMSGSPLLNQRTGKVCGIVKFTRDRSFDLGGGAIPTQVILEQFPELRELQREFHGGDRRWVNLITQSGIDFQPYLTSVATTYAKWWQFYTLTDAESKQRQVQESASMFDFGLMVQTVPKQEQEELQGSKQEKEKVERFSVLDGLRKYALGEKPEPVLLVGRPGSGKSTALARLMLVEATTQKPKVFKTFGFSAHSPRIPVLVELRYWQGSLADLIHNAIARHDPTLRAVPLDRLLANALILFDGVNELPSEEARTQLCAFRRDHAKLPMIFTTRDLSLGGDLGIERKLEMQPLTEPQMQAFIRAYIPAQAEAMLRQLKDRLREFGQTPLLLWMLCEVFQQAPNNQLPSNLGGVFQAFTQMYEASSVRKHEVALLKGDVRPLSDRRLWKKALMAIAAIMMQGKTPVDFRVTIHRDEAEGELSRIFPNEQFPVRDILDDLLKYHLLQNRGTDQIEFRHQLIQEYYAAEYLLRLLQPSDGKLGLTDDSLKRDYLNYLKWTEPIALMLALVDEENQALRVVKLAMDEVDLMLGARLAGEVKPSWQATTVGWIDAKLLHINLKVQCWKTSHSEKAVVGLLTALQDSNYHVRESAAEALGAIGSDEAVVGLLYTLQDSNNSVRESAATALGNIGSDQAVAGLLCALQDSNNFVHRSTFWRERERKSKRICEIAAGILGKIGNEQAVEGLLTALQDSNYYVRESVAEALGKVGSNQAIGGLLDVLRDPDNSVRRKAAEALKIVGSSQSMKGLLTALRDSDDFVRETTAEALGNIGSEQAVKGLLDALRDSGNSVRRKAAEALGNIGSENAVKGLLAALQDTDYRVRESAATALGNIGSENAGKGLLAALRDTDYRVRESAADALKVIDNKQTIAELLTALQDTDYRVRESAATALGNIGSENAVTSLLTTLQDPNNSVRESAATALGNIGSENAVTSLLTTLQESNYHVRWRAADALGKIGCESAVEGLLTALKDPDTAVRWSAAMALGKIGGDQAVVGLLSALQDSDDFVRESIAETLGEIGGDQAVVGLLSVLQDSDNSVRRKAAEALGKIGSEKAVEGLFTVLQDSFSSVREMAAEALGKIGSEKAVEGLLAALQDSGISVHKEVAVALGKIGSEKAVEGLLAALQDSDGFMRLCAADAVGKIGDPLSLADLWQLCQQHGENYFWNAISAIQNSCQFYNYDIFQVHLAAQQADR